MRLATQASQGPDESLVRRMYQESELPHRKLMEYLAANPDRWLYTLGLASALSLPHGAKSLAGMVLRFRPPCRQPLRR